MGGGRLVGVGGDRPRPLNQASPMHEQPEFEVTGIFQRSNLVNRNFLQKRNAIKANGLKTITDEVSHFKLIPL